MVECWADNTRLSYNSTSRTTFNAEGILLSSVYNGFCVSDTTYCLFLSKHGIMTPTFRSRDKDTGIWEHHRKC